MNRYLTVIFCVVYIRGPLAAFTDECDRYYLVFVGLKGKYLMLFQITGRFERSWVVVALGALRKQLQ